MLHISGTFANVCPSDEMPPASQGKYFFVYKIHRRILLEVFLFGIYLLCILMDTLRLTIC